MKKRCAAPAAAEKPAREKARLRLLARAAGFLAIALDLINAAEQLRKGGAEVARAGRKTLNAVRDLRAAVEQGESKHKGDSDEEAT